MNKIAIVINLNERHILIGAQWPTKATLKAMARLKLARLKRRVSDAFNLVAMAVIPLPQAVAA